MTHDFKAAAGELFLYIQSYFENKSNLSYKTVLDAQEALRIMAEVQEGRAKIVPVSATKSMTDNAMLYADFDKSRSYWVKAYKVMLAASPYNCTKCEGKEGGE